MVGRRFISGRQALGVEFDLRNALYGHLLRLSYRFFDHNQTGQLMSRATVDLQNVRFFLGYGLIFLVQHVLTVVGVTVHPARHRLAARPDRAGDHAAADRRRLALQPRLAPRAARRPAANRGHDHGRRGVDRRRQRRQGIRPGGSAGGEVQRARRGGLQPSPCARPVSRLSTRRRSASCRSSRRPPCSSPAGTSSATGRLSLGPFVAFNVYLLMLVFPLRMLGMWIGQIQRATAAGERIFQILDEPEEIRDAPARPRSACGRRAHHVRGRQLRVRHGRARARGRRASTSSRAASSH